MVLRVPPPKPLQAPNLAPVPGASVSGVWWETQDITFEHLSPPLLLVPQSLQGLTGTPLVAGSPIRHESAVQGSAVEVQTYQPPWKALSEFALQSDLDQPAFQQLVRSLPTHRTAGLTGVEFSCLIKVGRRDFPGDEGLGTVLGNERADR